jgi:dolichol kinase
MMEINELVASVLLFVWVMLVATILTRKLYFWMKSRGFEHNVAVYYNRKVIHMFAGGVCAIAVPFVFSTAFFPLVMAAFLAIFTYIPHKTGKLMYWFQTEDNMYEVTFAIMWGIIITLGWLVSGDWFIGVLPVLFMSVGDALTGMVRNYLYGKRTKSWWGNLAMAIFAIVVGTSLGIAGVIAGIVASVVEHFEFYPIDDNITVPVVSFGILVLTKSYTPWLLTF